MSILSVKTSHHQERANWSGIFAMTLCAFVLVASEFLPVSLLTPIASDLRVTEGLAGLGIAISGALAVLTSLTISDIAANVNRKHLLLGMTVLMAISGMIIAQASSYHWGFGGCWRQPHQRDGGHGLHGRCLRMPRQEAV